MKNVLAGFAAAVALLLVMAQVQPSMRIVLRDEGTTQGRAGVLDIVGSYGTAAISGNVGTITITSPTTTQGDLIYRGASADTRLAKGSAGQALLMNAGVTAPEWGIAASVSQFFSNGLGAGFNPTNNTNHYLSPAANPSNTAATAAGVAAPIIRRAGTITDVYFMVIVAGTNGSGEAGSTYIRVNNTTDNVVFNGTIVWNGGATPAVYSATGLSIALAAGDFWQFKIDPPTWVTVPTAVFYLAQVVVTFP